MTEITLNRKDVLFINEVVMKFDIESQVTLTQSKGYGVGSLLEMSWNTTYGGLPAKITVEVCGVEDW